MQNNDLKPNNAGHTIKIEETQNNGKTKAVASSANYEFLIPEVRKIIKQGKYQKAFFMLDQYFSEAKKLGTVAKIRMCRRIIVTLVTTTYNSLNKPEIRHPDELLKRLQVANDYIKIWQQSLSAFIVRTDQKFEHYLSFLEEIANSSDEENTRRNSSRAVTMKLSSPQTMRANSNRNDKQSNLLVQILKHQDSSMNMASDFPVETSFTDIDNSHAAGGEELSSNELNANFQLDEFFNYNLLHIMNYGLYYKKIKNWTAACRFLELAETSSRSLESSLNPNMLFTCAKVRIPLGTLYMEFDRYKDAYRIFEGVISLLQIELSIRFNRQANQKGSANFFVKVRKTVRLLVTTLLLCAKNYEMQDNYPRIIQSYRMAMWFCKKFISNDDELYRTTQRANAKAKEIFGKHLEEIGEMERVISENKSNLKAAPSDKEGQDRYDGFGRLQESLYKKYNCFNLNQLRLPLRVNVKSAGLKRQIKTETFDDTNDVNSEVSGAKAGYVGLQTGASEGLKTQTEFDFGDHNRWSTIRPVGRRKKFEDKIFQVKGQSWKQVPTDKWKLLDHSQYGENTSPDVRAATINVDPDQEQKYVEMLNRNIKNKRPITASSTYTCSALKHGPDFTDIDGFFQRQVDSRIDQSYDSKGKPQDFSKIVKNYMTFLKTENYDDKEFKSGKRTLINKHYEDLGELEKKMKYRGPAVLHEKRELETSAYFVTTQTQVENIIQSRISLSKTLSKPKARKAKFVTIGSFVPPKQPTIESPLKLNSLESSHRIDHIDIEDDSKLFIKPKLSDILLKHKTTLNLKTVAAVLKENSKRPKEELHNYSTQATETVEEHMNSNAKSNEKDWQRMNSMIKDRILNMMEDVEKDAKNDEIIKNRIKANRPIFQAKKPKEKFLKNADELASSTLLVAKRDAMKKSRDFASIIKQQVEQNRRERASKKRASTRITFSADNESPTISKRF